MVLKPAESILRKESGGVPALPRPRQRMG